jgi:hypothetical protein
MCDSKWKGGIAVYFAGAAVEVHKFILQKRQKRLVRYIFGHQHYGKITSRTQKKKINSLL